MTGRAGGVLAIIAALQFTAAASNEAVVHLSSDDHCSMEANYKGEHIGIPELNAQGGVITRGNVRFSVHGTDCMAIRALVDPVRFDSDALAGFSGDLLGSNEVTCCFCRGRDILDVSAGKGNAGNISLDLPDGATAAVTPGSSARLDMMKDGSYTFIGRGRVDAVTPEGQKLVLSANSMPMNGERVAGVKRGGRGGIPGTTPPGGIAGSSNAGATGSGAAAKLGERSGGGEAKPGQTAQAGGNLPAGSNLPGSGQPIDLAWDKGAPLVVTVSGERTTIKPGTGKVAKFGAGSQLGFDYSEGGTLKVSGLEGVHHLIIHGLNAVAVDVGQGSKVALVLDQKNGLFAVGADPGNPGAIALIRDNGAVVSPIDPGRNLKFVVSGNGLILGRKGLAEETEPGGKRAVAAAGTAKAGARPTLVSPGIAVKIGEVEKAGLRLRVGDTDYHLPLSGERDFTLPNGASIHFSLDPATGTLIWRALKGEFLISVEGVPGWKAVALSDGSGEMHWDTKLRMVDMHNTSADSMIMALPSRTFGVLSPASSFHYAAVGEAITNAPLGLAGISSYATAATGKVQVYNSKNGKSYDLGAQNLLFVGGLPTRLNLSGSRLPVQLSWDNGAPLFIAENQDHNVLKPGTQKVIKYGPDFHLGFVYSDGGTLKVTAVEGNYRLIIQRVNGLVVDLEEGCKVTFTLDLKKGTFVVRTDPSNPSALALALDNGTPVPSMDADRYLNFNISEDGSLFGDSGDGHVLFFDYAGSDPSTVSFSQSIPGGLLPPPPGPYDPTRLPATVIQ